MPKFRQRSILSIRWHWPTLTAFGPFWTVARHRMAIVPGDQFALWAPASPSLPLLPFTAIRSPFGASVRPQRAVQPADRRGVAVLRAAAAPLPPVDW